jgi:hypothetical protein
MPTTEAECLDGTSERSVRIGITGRLASERFAEHQREPGCCSFREESRRAPCGKEVLHYLRRQRQPFLQPIGPVVTDPPDAGAATVRLTANYADQASPETPVDQHRPLDVGITAGSA